VVSVNYAERMLLFDCEGEKLVGIVTTPDAPRKIGVLIVVGGPQYRVGSHRQFVLLARFLAAEGMAVMRFDYRGMGDSTGVARSFDAIGPDIAAAIDAMRAACPEVGQVVVWGLCDGASAALTYWQSTRDARVAGMVLLNPWVRSDASLAKAHIKHYYGQHLREAEFWKRLLSGRVDVMNAFRSLAQNVRTAGTHGKPGAARHASFQDRMAEGFRTFPGPILLILSGRDLTAKEFLEYVAANPVWNAALGRPNLSRCEVADADHTFSSVQDRREMQAATLAWLSRAFFPGSP
jgi:exosortase A-associated hydrolase 1